MSTYPAASGRRRQRQDAQAISLGSPAPPTEDDATREAVLAVVQVWLDRLQLISAITGFFASTDSLLLGFTTSIAKLGQSDPATWSGTVQLMNACITGALVFHTCAAIVSFVASFVLIRYKLLDADQHEHSIEASDGSTSRSPAASGYPPASNVAYSSSQLEKQHSPLPTGSLPNLVQNPTNSTNGSNSRNLSEKKKPGKNQTTTPIRAVPPGPTSPFNFIPQTWNEIETSISSVLRFQFQGRVSINRVYPLAFLSRRPLRHSQPSPEDRNNPNSNPNDSITNPPSPHSNVGTDVYPPIHLLSRAHSLSVLMAVLGFILGVTGILAFVWTALPKSVCIFVSAILGGCFVSGVWVFNS